MLTWPYMTRLAKPYFLAQRKSTYLYCKCVLSWVITKERAFWVRSPWGEFVFCGSDDSILLQWVSFCYCGLNQPCFSIKPYKFSGLKFYILGQFACLLKSYPKLPPHGFSDNISSLVWFLSPSNSTTIKVLGCTGHTSVIRMNEAVMRQKGNGSAWASRWRGTSGEQLTKIHTCGKRAGLAQEAGPLYFSKVTSISWQVYISLFYPTGLFDHLKAEEDPLTSIRE